MKNCEVFLPSMSKSPSGVFSSCFLTKILYAFLSSHMRSTCTPTSPPRFDRSDNIRRRVKIMMILIMQFFRASRYFLPLRSKRFPLVFFHCTGNRFPVLWPGNKNSPTVTHACRKRRLKWVATLPLGYINTEAWSSGMGVGRGANNPTL
jgi:hypothetical protein